MQNNKGLFISFEGIDGSGKSTQINNIKNVLKNKINREIIYTREPGGTVEAELIRKLILNSKINFENKTEILLLLAARYEHYKKLIEPSLNQGKIVICDRFIDSTIAYQCNKNNKLKNFFLSITNIILNNIMPDLTILLDLDPKVALKRLGKRKLNNHYDKKSLNFFKNVRDEYLRLSNNNNRIKIINSNSSEQEISHKIIKIILKKIN